MKMPRFSKYNTLQSAKNAMYNHCVKPHCIVLGNDGLVWLVTPAWAQRLERQGFTVIYK